MRIEPSNMPDLYRLMYRIRRFEETVLENFRRGVFFGTTHTYLGQEANAVGVITRLNQDDIIFSNHRCHGHFLAYGGEARALFAELMGRATGLCGGRGGSQHLHWRNFYSNGVQGGIVPVATGMAIAEKLQGKSTIVVAFLGDGTFGEGVVYESLNMASLWNVPILYVVENNHIAQTTPIERALAGEIAARFTAFNIPVCELETSNVKDILSASEDILAKVRSYGKARALILNTCRFGPHSKADDTRDPAEIARLRRERDPLHIYEKLLEPQTRIFIEQEEDLNIQQAYQQALQDPLPELMKTERHFIKT